MPTYDFRISFRLPPGRGINHPEPTLSLPIGEDGTTIVLHASEDRKTVIDATEKATSDDSPKAIKDAMTFAIRGSAWDSEEAAKEAGMRTMHALRMALLKMNVGADFSRIGSTKGHLFDAAIKWFENRLKQRVVEDQPGLTVFATHPPPCFARIPDMDARIVSRTETFIDLLRMSVRECRVLTEKEKLSLELYEASHFEASPNAQFLTLVMALEALLDPAPRPAESQAHVEEMMRQTRESATLSKSEKCSLLRTLKWLLQESIGQTGRKLAHSRLAGNKYDGRSPKNFFQFVYDMRSDLVHGNSDRPNEKTIRHLVPELRRFVSDLLNNPISTAAK